MQKRQWRTRRPVRTTREGKTWPYWRELERKVRIYQSDWLLCMTLPLTIHSISFSLADIVRSIHRSSQAKNLINLTWNQNIRYDLGRCVPGIHTPPSSSFKTLIRLSRAAREPFWILILVFATILLRGHPASSTTNPANALQPSSLLYFSHGVDLEKRTTLTDTGTFQQSKSRTAL